MKSALLALLAVTLATAGFLARADGPTARVSDLTDLASLLEGEFTTAPDPADGRTAAQGAPPPVYDLAKRVDVPGLGHDVVYAEIREGSPDGHLVHQRLYALKQDENASRIVMTTYDLGSAPELAGAYANPSPLAKLNPPDLKPQTKGCEVAWHRTDSGFVGQTGDQHCTGTITAVSKTGLTLATGVGDQSTALRRLR